MSQITLRNARLLAEDHFTAPTTLHISNARITATGDEAADGSAGEVIDVDGQFVMPGFIESHGLSLIHI